MKMLLNKLGLVGGCQEKADKLAALDQVQSVIEFSMDGTILHANENFLNTMGYRLEEIVGKHHSMFVKEEDRAAQEYRSFWDALNRGESRIAEYPRVGKGGKEIWLWGSYNPLMDGNGKPYKIIEFANNITETKREQEQQKKNADIANALRLCQANVMLADENMTVVYMNDTLKEMLKSRESELRAVLPQFSVEKLIGTCVDDFHVNPSHQRSMMANLKEPYKTDLNIEDLTFGLIASPWFDVSGNKIGIVVEWEDKTEKVKQERELAEEAARNLRIRQALDVCDTSVMLADDDLNIIYMNDAVTNMLTDRETELRSALPNFNSKSLLGQCVDSFHKNPSHQRTMLRNLREVYKTDINVAGLTFGLIATPLFNKQGDRLGTVVEWDDKTERLEKEVEEKRVANENARVRLALDTVTANVMIADKDSSIIYANNALSEMMKTAESDLKKVLSNFDASNLIGKNMDVFHKNPAHQRGLIENLRDTYKGKAEVGGRTFSVIATPIIVQGERLGTVIEWDDRTDEVGIEREIDEMVDAASTGDFTKQISLDGKVGFVASLSRGLNELVSTIEVSMNDVLRMLGAMARGDLTERITRDYQGSFGQLKHDANLTADKLTEIIGSIRTSARSINSAANEIAQGNTDLSQRTEEQASSLEETASSMEEMTSTVRQSADNAMQANRLSSEAQNKAKKGGEVVENAIGAMEEINASSKKISDIISVIDEIAFQTNLLALNAAVEAARAGEQGRGFAVVAGEVRNLAQRSAGAAKEIKELIRDSVEKVQDGQELVNASGETLSSIVGAVEDVCIMMQDISDAAQEQTSGIEQVNTAISQMDEMTQQNAALVEEASAAGQAMAEQATALSEMVQFFSVSDSLDHPVDDTPVYSRTEKNVESRVVTQTTAPAPQPDEDDWQDF